MSDSFEAHWKSQRTEEIAEKMRDLDSVEFAACSANVQRALRIEVERAAEDLADHTGCGCCGRLAGLSHREIYERAVQITLERLAERFEMSIESLSLYKLRGALGEFEEVAQPGHRPFGNRALNNLISSWKSAPCACACSANTFSSRALNVQLMNDASWWKRHYELHSKKKEAA